MNKALKLHINKLAILDKVEQSFTNSGAEFQELTKVLSSINATAWFESAVTLDKLKVSTKKLNQTIQLAQLFISSLIGCEGPSNFKERIEIYKTHDNAIKTNHYKPKKAIEAFKNVSIESYYKNLSEFKGKLSSYKFSCTKEQKNNFYQFSFEIMKHLDSITSNKNEPASLNFKNVLRLNQILVYCVQALDNLKQGKDIEPIASHLNQLSKKISNNAPLEWQSLGKAIKSFVSILRLIGKTISGPLSDKISSNQANSKKKLARSLTFFASTIKGIAKNSTTKDLDTDSPDADRIQTTRC